MYMYSTNLFMDHREIVQLFCLFSTGETSIPFPGTEQENWFPQIICNLSALWHTVHVFNVQINWQCQAPIVGMVQLFSR